MSNRQPIEKFEANAIRGKHKDVITATLLNEHKRANDLANRLKTIYAEIDTASTAGKTQPPSTDEQSADAKVRLQAALKAVLDKLKLINISDLTLMTANTSLDGVQIVEDNRSADSNKNNTDLSTDTPNNVTKSYKLDSNTKTFSGNPGERLSHWLFIINDAFVALNVSSDQMKLSLVTNYVKAAAFNALMRYRKNANPTWTGFEELLRAQFEDSNLDYKVRTQFFHLKMTDSFPKYLARFQELLNQMTVYSDNDTEILYKFTDGLVKEYALAVRRDKCETLTEAIKVCQDIDCLSRDYNTINQNNESINKVKRINFSKMNFRPNNVPNRNFQTMKNRFPNNRYGNKPMNSFKSNYLKQPSMNKYANYKSNKKVDLNDITCYKCKSKGHYSNSCKGSSSNSKPILNKTKKVYSIDVYIAVC